ncbi:ECF RNA polymerase sigma factor SigK [Enemella evansiae]|uniref:ECF RNA polymerase sigma factor SigK n=1 Tax=Enemella evansiae TaxID=2016499 RepID=UPI001E31C664|nr:ECF RNA polymerase sigma factor SigK [Enemella evansiae]
MQHPEPGRGVLRPVPGSLDRTAELLGRCARGDDGAFAEFYDLTSARVYGLVLRVVRAPDLAAEVTQEIYLEVWQTSARYRPERGSVWAWLTTLAHRRAVDRVRSVERERQRDTRWAGDELETERDQTWQQAESSLEAERVRRGMDELTGLQREALQLAYYGGYTQQQVASLLEVPLGTVKSRMRDGLTRLRDVLRGDHD